jgi:hypothetical protein
MRQTHNLNATVADKPALQCITLAAFLFAAPGCAEASEISAAECSGLTEAREKEVRDLMARFDQTAEGSRLKAMTVNEKIAASKDYVTPAEAEAYLNIQSELDQIEKRYETARRGCAGAAN